MKLSRIRAGLIVGASVAAVAALAGCSSTVTPPPTSTSTAKPTLRTDASGDLSIMVASNPAYVGCVTAAAATWATQPGGLKVDIQTEPPGTFETKVLTTFSSGTSPWDLVINQHQVTEEFKPFLMDLSSLIPASFLKGINKDQLSLYTVDNQLYGVPFVGQGDSLFYRTDLFQEAGLTPPTTWAQYNKDAKFFTNNPKFPGVVGIAMKGAEPWDETLFNDIYLGLGGKPLAGTPGTKMDVKTATEALTLLKQQFAYSQPGALSETQNDAAPLFATGVAAMAPLSPGLGLGAVNATTSSNKVVGKVGIAEMPGKATEAGGWGLVIPKTATRPNAAIRFLEYLKSDKEDLACMVNNANGAVRDASYTDSSVKNLWWVNGFYANVNDSQPVIGAKSAESGAIATAMGTGVAQFLAGQIPTASAAATQLAASYSQNVG